MPKVRIKGRLRNPVVETEHVVVVTHPREIQELLIAFDPEDPSNPANARLYALLETAESHVERVVRGDIEFEGLEAVELPHFAQGALVRERGGAPHVTWRVLSVREHDHSLRLSGPGNSRGISYRPATEMESVESNG